MERPIVPTEVKYQIDVKNKNKGKVIIEPCYPGYGVTWGNALRRVLLSSLSGGAVTAVKIKGVKHEFSTIKGVKEDVLQIILNLKKLRVKVHKDEPVELRLKVRGEKEVKASDFEKNADAEIVNPDLVIATLTDKKAELDMNVWVEKGFGYVPSEEKMRENFEAGAIVMDSIFSPIVKVGFNVENTRFGEKTDYDRIILDIETDGTISPKEAYLQAAKILAKDFQFLSEITKEEK